MKTIKTKSGELTIIKIPASFNQLSVGDDRIYYDTPEDVWEYDLSGLEVVEEVNDEIWSRLISSNCGEFEDFTKRNENISYYDFKHPWQSARSLLVYFGLNYEINKKPIKDNLLLLKCIN